MIRPASLLIFLAAIALLPLSSAGAQGIPSLSGNERIKVRLVLDRESLQPPTSSDAPVARIGVMLDIERGWHTYWRNSGEAAIPTKVSWELPEGWHTGPLQWPVPTRFIEKGSITTYGYRNQVLLWAQLYAPEVIPEDGQRAAIGAKVSWLVCKQICVPGSQTVRDDVPFSTSVSLQPSKDLPLFEKYAQLTPKAWEELKQTERFRAANFRVNLTKPNEETLVARLELDGMQPAERSLLASSAQVFPYSATGLVPGKPSARLTENGVLLRLPAVLRAPGATEWGGVVVLGPRFTGLENDTAFEWHAPLDSNIAVDASAASEERFLPLTHRVVGADEDVKPAPVSVERTGSLWGALLAAFIAGLLLNLMPCVLPIISIKIMGFVSQADHSRLTALLSSFSFAAGILVSFLALALFLITFRSYGLSLGWGFQFQYPQFVAALLLVVFFLSLALFDFYTVNLPFMQSANDAASKVRSPVARHFFDGVLATLLSTPCTAPILGTALVFAFTQPPIYTVLVFLMIGVGLALPYVYFSSHPALLERLPQPGNWMFHFRQTMGFLLLGTCAWLLSVLHDLTDKGAVWAIVLMLLLFFFLWMRKTMLETKPERGRSIVFNVLFFGALLGTGYLLYPDVVQKRGAPAKGLIEWRDYSPALLDEAAAKKQPVFIDFTASWCITCKFNEFRMIETAATAEAIKRANVLAIKADWTSGDEEITTALRKYGAEGVPLYVVIPKNGGEPIVLSTLPAQSTLLEALKKADS